MDNAAITDMFAGCFFPDIESVRQNQGLSYMDVREDRAVFALFGPEVKEISYKLRVTAWVSSPSLLHSARRFITDG